MRAAAGLVLLLVLLLVALSPGAGKPCDATKEEARCYGRLGGEIEIQLVNSLQNSFIWKRGNNIYIVYRNGVIGTSVPRVSFSLNNGTAKIVQLNKADAGNNSLIFYDSDTGQRISNRTMQLLIEAPVAAIHLVSECLPRGEQLVSCSSVGGDNLQYGWSLNQRPLQDEDLAHGELRESKVTLRRNISGWIVCSVRNNVSEGEQEICLTCALPIPDCCSNGTRPIGCRVSARWDASFQDLVLIIRTGVLAGSLLLLVGIVLYTLSKSHHTHAVVDEQELTYVNLPRQNDATER